MIPKFLICYNSECPDLRLVLHTEAPKFLAEIVDTPKGAYDVMPVQKYESWPEGTTPKQARALMKEMRDWYVTENSKINEL